MAIGLAFKVFFAVLFRAEAAERVRQALAGVDSRGLPQPTRAADSRRSSALEETTAYVEKPSAKPDKRSEALTLLSTLQREARFLDLIGEPLESFEDAQIGAAAREVVSDCRKALERMFGIEPLSPSEEGAACPLPKGFSASRFRIVGKEAGDSTSGVVAHRGWKATRCQLPTWTGSADDSLILAPTEIEVS